VSFAGQSEEQRSSGVWVCTAAGSTGAARSAGGRVLPFASNKLQLVVREPYLEVRNSARPDPISLDRIVFQPPETMTLLSKMEDARLYLDGPYRQVPVGLGDRVVCGVSAEPLTVFGLGRRRNIPSIEKSMLAETKPGPAPRKKKRRRSV
jgi:NAD+ kinase